MLIPDKEYFNHPIINPRYLNRNYPEFYAFLRTTYPGLSIAEALYRWYHNLTEAPVCVTCGNPVRFNGFTKGYARYCSYKCMNSNEDKKDTTRKTLMRKYGVTNISRSEEVKARRERTNTERYGTANTFASPIIKERIRKTLEGRYGVDHVSKSPEIMAKASATFRAGHPGLSSPLDMPECKENREATRITHLRDVHDDILDVTDDGLYICPCPHPGCDRCKEGKYQIKPSTYFDRHRDGTEPCTHILPMGKSGKGTTPELFVQAILDEYGIEYKTNIRNIIPPYELDIYIPDRNIAIECNGVYWHSTMNRKDKSIHMTKHTLCRNRGIQLLTVWEDWIKGRPEIIRSIILSKLGIYDRRIYARECEVRETGRGGGCRFLDRCHIQGHTNASVYLGLYFNGTLTGLMTFSRRRGCVRDEEGVWELSRFCTERGTGIVGGASRLLTHFIRMYGPREIISFSSNDISTGALYERLGFIPAGINPAYWYIDLGRGFRRYHRSNFTKQAIRRRGWAPEGEDWTEAEVMMRMGFARIYDSGQVKWILKINNK